MEDNKKIYLIGNAHLDPAWLWRWQEGYGEVKSTFKAALDRLCEYEDFVFTCSSAAYYKWIEEDEPEMFQQIKKYVEEGRWEIVGGWWIQPDCNMPSGESFVRQGLYSQRYFLSRFGKIAKTGYNVDSFGHNGNLPQILKKSGMINYLFSRPGEHEKHIDKSLFWWEANDGSRVLAIRLPTIYPTKTLDELKENLNTVIEATEKEGTDLVLSYGVGNHGGGPTIEMLNYLTDYIKSDKEKKLIFSGTDKYFEDIRLSGYDIPIIKDDMQHHASGCYSTHSGMKKANRYAENAIINAEKYASLAKVLTGKRYEIKEFNNAWENVLFNQFHDILCGCSISIVHEDAMKLYGESMAKAARITNSSVQKISYRIDTLKGECAVTAKEKVGRPFVIFNPLSWPVKIPVRVRALCQIDRTLASEKETVHYSAFDCDGGMVTVQHIQSEHLMGDVKDGIFVADVAAYGYSLYYVRAIQERAECNYLKYYKVHDVVIENSIKTAYGYYVMENNNLLVEIDSKFGGIKRLYDKIVDFEVFNGVAATGIVMEDWDNDTWGHDKTVFRDKVGSFGEATVSIVEEGPVRCVIRSKTVFANSTLVQDFILYADAQDLEVQAKVEWREKHKMLKLSFPVNVENPSSFYEIPYGYKERACNGEEEPALNWVDVTGVKEKKQYGVAILNDCKYSFSVLNNEIQLMAVRSSIYGDHGGIRHSNEDYEYLDWGVQTFKYIIKPHSGDFRKSNIIKRAVELNTEYEIVNESYHNGVLPQRDSFIHIVQDNIIVSAIKRSEEDDGYIIRAYETSGQETVAEINIKLFDKKLKLIFTSYEIKTVKLYDNGIINEVNLIEE